MARSLRSNRVQKNKVLKRRAYFGDVAKAREERIAERLHGSLDKAMATAAPADTETSKVDAPAEDAMAVETPVKKVSTAGWSTKNNHKRRRHLKTSKQMSKRRR